MTLSNLADPNKKVLVADDVKSARIGLRAQLAKLGLRHVIEAVDGNDAWEKLQRESDVQLIILDWLMPGIDGRALAERIQTDERLKYIPVIMATNKGEWENMAEATSAGVWGYLVKPITLENLEAEIELVMKTAREIEREG